MGRSSKRPWSKAYKIIHGRVRQHPTQKPYLYLLTWNERLFDKGLFSDLTIILDKHHTFEVHSFILVKKSSFFAEQCNGTATLTLTECTFPLSIIKNDGNDKGEGKADTKGVKKENKRDDKRHDKKDVVWSTLEPHTAIRHMLRFCYTGEYDTSHYSKKNTEAFLDAQRPAFHTYMNFLACTYGIDELKKESIRRFAIDVKDARTKWPQEVMGIMEDLYTARATLLLSDPFKDELYAQAKAMVNMKMKQMQQHMPKILGSLVMLNAKALECIRCGTHLNPNNRSNPKLESETDPHLCLTCSDDLITDQCIMVPMIVKTGTQLVLWVCQSCQSPWSTEGRKVQNMPLEKCTYCNKIDNDGRQIRSSVKKSTCLQCKTVWAATRVANFKYTDMEMRECICCPEKK
jgi:hypothetical protein